MSEKPAGRETPQVSSHAVPKETASVKTNAQLKSGKITTSGAEPRWSAGALRKAEQQRVDRQE